MDKFIRNQGSKHLECLDEYANFHLFHSTNQNMENNFLYSSRTLEKNDLPKKETVEDLFEGVPPPPEANDWRGLFDWGGNTLPPMSWDTEPLTPWGEEEDCNLSEKCVKDTVQENVVEQKVEQEEFEEEDVEYRFDPTADNWFTKGEFVDYYGDDTMWEMLLQRRTVIVG